MRFLGVIAVATVVLALSSCSGGDAGSTNEPLSGPKTLSVEELGLNEEQWREEVVGLGVPESHLVVAEAAAKPLCSHSDVDELAVVLHASLNASEPDLAALPEGVYGLGVRYLCPEDAGHVAEAVDLLEDIRTGEDALCALTLDESYREPGRRQFLWANVCTG